MGMQILTASSNCQSAVEAVADIKKILVPKEGKLPKFILVYYTEDFSETELHQAFTAQFPDVEITGIQVANGSFDRNVTAGFPEESLKVTVLLAVKPSSFIISPAAFVIVIAPSSLGLDKLDKFS